MFWLNIPKEPSNFIFRHLCTYFRNSLSCIYNSKYQRIFFFLFFLHGCHSSLRPRSEWNSAPFLQSVAVWSCDLPKGHQLLPHFEYFYERLFGKAWAGPSPWPSLLYLPIHIWWETGHGTGSPCTHIALCSCYRAMHTLAFLSHLRRERNTAESSFLPPQTSYWKW